MPVPNIIVVNTTPTVNEVIVGVGKGGSTGPAGPVGATEVIPVFTMQREIYPLVGQSRLYIESNRTITLIRASLGTPPLGSAAVMRAYVNGVSIGSVSIAAGTYTSSIAISKPVQQGDYLTVSVISVGSTTPGEDLTVTFNLN